MTKIKLCGALLCVILSACARASEAPVTPVSTTRVTFAVVPEPSHEQAPREPDHTARLERNADRVFREMHDDLMGCFARSGMTKASIRVDALVGTDGRVRQVEATNERTLARSPFTACIEKRVARATFEPSVAGTSHFTVPLAFAFETNRPAEP